MAGSNAQEKMFKRTFNENRLAALRGDTLGIPEAANSNDFFEEEGDFPQEAANNNRFFSSESEDGIMAQYPLAPATPNEPAHVDMNPESFSRNQQQARRAQGIGAPSLLPDDIAALPDPEYSTEDDVVTFGDTLDALQGQADQAEDIEEVQALSGALQRKMNEAGDQAAERMKEWMQEKMSRWTAKGVGNGANAADSVGWDAWITFCVTYLYLMARGAVSVLSPETQAPPDLQSFRDAVQYNAQKALHTVFPPYRPLLEPFDFLYFLFLLVMSVLIVCIVLAVFIGIVNFILFPLFIPGGPLSST